MRANQAMPLPCIIDVDSISAIATDPDHNPNLKTAGRKCGRKINIITICDYMAYYVANEVHE